MKNIKSLARIVSICAAGFALHEVRCDAGLIDILRGEKQSTQVEYQRVAFVGSAVVKQVEGMAQRLHGIDSWTAITKGERLEPGDIIRTQDGTIILRMNESQSFVKVTPHTVLRLMEFDQGWDRGVISGKEEKSGFVVRSCRGKAFYREGDAGWMPVLVNTVLKDGAFVRTEPDTTMDLFCTTAKRPLRLNGASEVSLSSTALVALKASQPILAAAGGR